MPSRLDRMADRPLYQQIADSLRIAIVSGRLQPEDQLPSERDLIDEFGAARGTVRQALALLRAEGLVDVEHGRGAFVRPRPPIRRLGQDRFARKHRRAGRAAFMAEVAADGRKASVEVLEVRQVEVDAEVAERLGVLPGADVLRRRRRYLADGEPLELATSYLPYELVEGSPIEGENPGPGGIYARLEDMGYELERFTEEVAARMPFPEEARALQLRPGVPVFRLVRTAYTSEGRPVEVCDTVMAADRYVLTYELPAR